MSFESPVLETKNVGTSKILGEKKEQIALRIAFLWEILRHWSSEITQRRLRKHAENTDCKELLKPYSQIIICMDINCEHSKLLLALRWIDAVEMWSHFRH